MSQGEQMREQPVDFDPSRLFLASCVALVTTAMFFSIRGDVLAAFGAEFNLSHTQQGYINAVGIWGFPLSILFLGPFVDAIGMRRLLIFAACCHVVGVALTIVSPSLGFGALLVATLVLGIASGTVEAVVNPLVASMYSRERIHRLNMLHAWWPGGLIVGGLLAYAVTKIMGIDVEGVSAELVSLSWKVKYAFIIIGAIIYLYLVLGQQFPPTERAAAGVSSADMWRAIAMPGFLVLLLAMCMTATTELGPDAWLPSVMSDLTGIQGVLYLVYTSAIMFVMRYYAGPVVHRLSPFGLLIAAAVMAALGLFSLSLARSMWPAFAAATLYGIGKAYFWPTMLGISADRYPRTGSLGLALMGAAGMMAAGLAQPGLGWFYDKGTLDALPAQVQQQVLEDGHYSPNAADALATADPAMAETLADAEAQGAATAFRAVSVIPVLLIFVFGAWYLFFRGRGGYEALTLEHGAGEETMSPPTTTPPVPIGADANDARVHTPPPGG